MVLCKSEIEFAKQGLLHNMRKDGRKRMETRKFSFGQNSVFSDNSCTIKYGKNKISVDIRVDFEIESPLEKTLKTLNALITGNNTLAEEQDFSCNVEFSALNKIEDMQNKENELRRKLSAILKSSDFIRFEEPPVKNARFVLFLDVLILSDEGNLLEAITIATRTAFENLKIPMPEIKAKTTKESAEFKDLEIKEKRAPFANNQVPFCVTVGKVDDVFFLDPTRAEESAADFLVEVVLSQNGDIIRVDKTGKMALSVEDLSECLKIALDRSSHLFKNFVL